MSDENTKIAGAKKKALARDFLIRQAYGLAATGLVAAAAGPALLYSRISRKPVPGLVPGFSQRMGRYCLPLFSPDSNPRVWMHAVSVGEAVVARAVFRELVKLVPGMGLVLSTGTLAGNEHAKTLFGKDANVVYAPLDFPPATRAALRNGRPSVLVFTETEIWPGWIWEAHRRNIPVVVVNGRLSERSLRRYSALGPVFREVLACISAFSMASAKDAWRMKKLSHAPHRIFIAGNAKFDGLMLETTIDDRKTQRERLGISTDRPVLVCGSTRTGEEQVLLDAFRMIRDKFPDAFLVLAPRHLSRLSRVIGLVNAAGLTSCLWSKAVRQGAGESDCMVVDAMGELFSLYGAADLAFCGGSLVPRGGQNMMEPAAWSVPVLFGPHTEDFSDARDLLVAADGGFVVEDSRDIAKTAVRLLSDPGALVAAGRNARGAVLQQQGAAARHAAVIAKFCR